MLTARGFKKAINMRGGIKAWASEKAVGAEEVGLSLFSGMEAVEELLVVAYSLEKGLQDFYESLIRQVKSAPVRRLFEKLAAIEVVHQERVYNEYRNVTKRSTSQQEFEQNLVVQAMEGGLTTGEYLDLYEPDLEVEADVIVMAMSIEAQALDLYLRVSERVAAADSKHALKQIAEEERVHLKQLGQLLES